MGVTTATAIHLTSCKLCLMGYKVVCVLISIRLNVPQGAAFNIKQQTVLLCSDGNVGELKSVFCLVHPAVEVACTGFTKP